MFSLNQIVRGVNAGTFVILGFRMIGNQRFAQLKEICPVTHRMARGELALPVDCLRNVEA